MNSIVCASINPVELTLKKEELVRYLKTPEPFEIEEILNCTELVRQTIAPVYCYAKSGIEFCDDGCRLDFMKNKSKGLFRTLSGCREAYVAAVTLGIDTDRLIARLMLASKARAFVADAVASAFAESAMDYVNSLFHDFKIRERYSVGFGDFVLSNQAYLLDYIKADKLLGIKLTENYMMTPRKSVTAIIGVAE